MSLIRLIHSLRQRNVQGMRQRKGRGILVWGESVESFMALAPALREFRSRFPRANAYLFGPPAIMKALAAVDLPGIPVPEANRSKSALKSIFKKSKARVLLVAWPSRESGPAVAIAQDRSLPVLLCQWSGSGDSHLTELLKAWPQLPDQAFIQDSGMATALTEAGLSETALFKHEPGDSWPDTAARNLVDQLEPVVGGNTEVKLMNRRLAAAGRWISENQRRPLWGWLVRCKWQGLRDLAELSGWLGSSETIICLGNGPSSTDPRLAEIRHDALFRVNHLWADRGYLDRPDVVFTGSISTLEQVGHGPLFAFQTQDAERRILPKSLLLPRKIEYFVAEVLGTMDFDLYGSYKPTNGAVMLSTAIALAPKRLVIAGIDLYQHPAGAYPSDTNTPNAYTIGHDEEAETQFILSLLLRYRGELTILSEVLERKWQEALAGSAEGSRDSAAAQSQA